jgi:hypothetical protein
LGWLQDGSQRQLPSSKHGQWRAAAPALLRLQEVAPKLCLDPLKLLLGSIASNGGESSLFSGYICVLGFGACGTKFIKHGPLFIGLLVWTRRGLRVLQFLSLNRTLIRLCLEDFLERNQTRVGYDTETEFPVGLAWVKVESLSGIRSGCRVRSGPG